MTVLFGALLLYIKLIHKLVVVKPYTIISFLCLPVSSSTEQITLSFNVAR